MPPIPPKKDPAMADHTQLLVIVLLALGVLVSGMDLRRRDLE